jgi:hypothetical protein
MGFAALHKIVFLGKLENKTGSCAPPLAHAASLIFFQ